MVRFSDVGWTDITATTAVVSEISEGLGYKTKTQLLSVPVTYTSLANGDIDVFFRQLDANDASRYRTLPKAGLLKILVQT